MAHSWFIVPLPAGSQLLKFLSQGTKTSLLQQWEVRLEFQMPQEKEPAWSFCIFKIRACTDTQEARLARESKTSPMGTIPRKWGIGLEKRRDTRDRAHLKGCHGKGRQIYFVIDPERRVRIAGGKLQRGRFQFNVI